MKIATIAWVALIVLGGGCQRVDSKSESVVLRSSAIREAAYDRGTQALSVVFPNGSRYVYAPVPEQTFLALRDARSPGQFFNSEIKPRYTALRATSARPVTPDRPARRGRPVPP
ncbi:MAG: KTSC domain-containing protein [Lentisphaerae bacterium]|nr:KTSC domain-containing protein [Lentisphaerota bacterium]